MIKFRRFYHSEAILRDRFISALLVLKRQESNLVQIGGAYYVEHKIVFYLIYNNVRVAFFYHHSQTKPNNRDGSGFLLNLM